MNNNVGGFVLLKIIFALMSFDAQTCTCICICNIFMHTPKLKFRPGGCQGGMVTSLIKLYNINYYFFSVFGQSKWLLQIQCNYKCRYILPWWISKIKLQLFQIDVLLPKIITTERKNSLAHKMRHFLKITCKNLFLILEETNLDSYFLFISRTSRNR